MVRLIRSKKSHRWSKEIAPAILILILTISLSVFLGDFTFLKGSEAIYKGLFRFFRITLLPLPSFLFVIARLWMVAEGSPEKKQRLSSSGGETGSRNSSCETLAPSPSSGNWYRATLWNETSFGSSGSHRDNGFSLFTHPQRAVPIRTIHGRHWNYSLDLSPSIHDLDFG